MNLFCVRIDLDYVPWDTPDARQFGHGEPAVLIRLLDLARTQGYRFHFFASERFLRAFPTGAEAVLNDGHDLDYFAKHPEDPTRVAEAIRLLAEVGHTIHGWAIRTPIPESINLSGLQFLSGPESVMPASVRGFPILEPTLHEAMRSGESARHWLSTLQGDLTSATNERFTAVLSPQVLARSDPYLQHVRDFIESTLAAGRSMRTLRQII